MDNIPTTLTPATINDIKDIKFNIPIYQRLFVWEEQHINRLLDDLFDAMDTNKPYYIGIITVSGNETTKQYDLVDGQQRMTFLMLLATALKEYYKRWNDFLDKGDDICKRVTFFARPKDEEDVKKLYENFEDSNIENENIRRFRDCFNKFKNQKKEKDLEEKEVLAKYAEYVYEKCTFLMSILPKEYEIDELNLYYEKMNATGKQLEPHEILKVKYFAEHSSLWNNIADFTKFYVSKDAPETATKNPISILDILKDSKHNDDLVEPEEKIKEQNAIRAIIDFPTFLLHVLALTVGEDIRKKVSLEPSKLLNTFDEFNEFDKSDFIKNMKSYRVWLDSNIIHINENDSQEKYAFWTKDKTDKSDVSDTSDGIESIPEKEREVSKKMKQLQSMLYVSSFDNQKWLLEAYNKTEGNNLTFNTLQEVDNELHELAELVKDNKIEAKYPNIERYWFWKLDFILWLNRKDVFDDNFKAAIDNFAFKQNRSIEHLHAQNRENDNAKQDFTPENKDYFGNLAMISGSTNSSVSNKTVGEKFARIKDRSGVNIESLKLLLMFCLANGEDSKWTYEKAKEHEEAMIKLLEGYYGVNK